MVNQSSAIIPTGAQRGTYLKLQSYFSEIVDHYIFVKDNEKILSYGSIINNANRGTMFFYYLQANNHFILSEVTEDDVISFFIKDGKSFREASYRYRLSEFLKTVSYRYPECAQLNNWLPFIRQTRKNIQYLTEEEVKAIKETLLSESSCLTYCERAIGLILLYTGLRGCDIAALKLENINWDKELISLDQSKTDVGVIIPLHVYVGNAIYDYLKYERKSGSEYLFVDSDGNNISVSKLHTRVDKIYKTAGVRQNKGARRGTHIFRHHMITTYLKNEVPQPVITRASGHSCPSSDEAYFSSDIEHLRKCALSIEEFSLNWEVFDHV